MALFITTIWNDPVFSKVIAGIILLIIGWIFRANIEKYVKKFILILSNLKKRRTDLTPNDIIAIIDSWWPKSTDTWPKDVTVNFKDIEKKYKLPTGSVNQYIDVVATKNCFKQKFRGPNNATFEYDIEKAMRGRSDNVF